ncbi:Sec-independent protein translocase subunit TatA [Pseudonocardia abyssalis]|uniref:Sec-independent protein translocase protein TatA n=1 Tax=Pseudonocardia abyssalis TaxID=2792008 RepID=A0ABS6UV14_9PSEU|nr:Sec-independent protein translocase subunit TatA [Pseudonocardia abyssalis]MBW0116915.1 Sec-independent protein translocase subunit TatA [Pseudonocardia abyssalis]MBW0136102.1 Sec-independent protein translocase subunit TatA [Pseudonocardia abyssalis]
MPNLGGWELIVLLGVLLLIFGAKKLPDMARSIGQSARVFKGEMKGLKEDGKTDGAAPAAPAAHPSSTLPVIDAPAPTAQMPVVEAERVR